mgnify:CR=1 FL=1
MNNAMDNIMDNAMTFSANQLLEHLLDASLSRQSPESMAQWFAGFQSYTSPAMTSVDRAIIGGRHSLNLAFSFAAGYQSAIESIFNLASPALSSFCVSEEKGNHPRAIATHLKPVGNDYVLNGNKSFVSGGCDAKQLFIACNTGDLNNEKLDDRPALKMISIPANTSGITIEAMPPLPFISEISHGKISLTDVKILPEQLLPGDGYSSYIKPFRTYEDIHVLAAVLGFRLGEAIDSHWDTALIEQHLAICLSLRMLNAMSLHTSEAHLALAGCRTQIHDLFQRTDSLFEQTNPLGYAKWQKDQPLLAIAKKAHVTRTAKAWQEKRT